MEGELPEDGLAAYGDDLMPFLSRKIVSREETPQAATTGSLSLFEWAVNAEEVREEELQGQSSSSDGGWPCPAMRSFLVVRRRTKPSTPGWP